MPLLDGPDYDLRGQQVRVTFLHTSDIHSRLLQYDYSPIKTDIDLGIVPEAGPFGGATRIGAILKRERAASDRVLHVDSGDSFQGAPIFNINTGEAEFRFLSLVGLNAAVIGNHEFDAGALNFSLRARDQASFPLLAANYIWESPKELGNYEAALNTAPYTIENIKGLRVGIIGMANVSSLNSLVEGGNSLQATPWEQNEALRAWVDLLRPSVDLVIVTSHLGLTEDQELVNGYDAYFEYGKIKSFLEREHNPWQVLEWFGVDPDTASPEQLENAVVRVWIPGVSGVDIIFGGHLHIVLNPPQTLLDPSNRKVLLVHSGAFAKFVGRLDTVIKVPDADAPPEVEVEGAEVLSHDYKVFPVDGVWCDDTLRTYYHGQNNFWDPGEYRNDPRVIAGMAACQTQEDRETYGLMLPYVTELDFALQLSTIFAYTPRDIMRRNNSTGGDSPLGNMAADSMRKRSRVEAEVAVTNTLGIRDNLYAGVLHQEAMFNVFPFENTINIMYLSGVEMQELFDFVASRSASRGCAAQAQISGARFVMDCAQAQLNEIRYPCNAAADCPTEDRETHAPWQCLEDAAGKRCWANPATDISIQGKPLDANGVYKIAVNDYIAKGGSGFSVLKRNTTRIETGIPLRDSLISYMQNYCSCEDILRPPPPGVNHPVDEEGNACGVLINGVYTLDPQIVSFCSTTLEFQKDVQASYPAGGADCRCVDVYARSASRCPNLTSNDAFAQAASACTPKNDQDVALFGPALGKCSCLDVLENDTTLCGNITPQLRAFCAKPGQMAIAIGQEDGRIGRRLK